MLYAFGKLVTYLLVRILFKMRYEGLDRIPASKGFILACNHRSNFDPLFIAHKVSQPVRYMAKAELFATPALRWLFNGLRAFPVARGKGDTGAIDTAKDIIRGGGVMGMFPEGTRSRDGTPLRPRSGVALIAAQTQADILPVAVCFGRKLSFRTPVTVRYGELILFGELNADAQSPASIRGASKKIMEHILALLDEGV